MIVRSLLPSAAAAAWLMTATAGPAAAVEFGLGGRPFEALMGDGFRIVAAVPMPGLVVPVLVLAKDGTPDAFMCFQQFRDCPRLKDSPTNTPPGLGLSPAPDVPLR